MASRLMFRITRQALSARISHMHTPEPSIWWLRITTLSLAALTAASVTYWVLPWFATPPSDPRAALVQAHVAPPDPQAVARVLGGGQTTTAGETAGELASHFKLSGVVVEPPPGGYAVITVDDQPPKPFRVGDAVGEGLVLHSVTQHSAALAVRVDAPVSVTLDLPEN
jgi:general secretion pathway protein C